MDGKIRIDFAQLQKGVTRSFERIMDYFKTLATDMVLAWSALGIGLVLLIVGIIII